MIPPEKIAGLEQTLDDDGRVRFRNGSVVVRDPADPADLIVTLIDGVTRRVNPLAHDQFVQAYEIALAGPQEPLLPEPRIRPTRSTTDFGDDPPF